MTTDLLLTVTGRDHPGVVARLTGVLADANAELLDVEQVVVGRHLTLALCVRLPEGAEVMERLVEAATELGVQLESAPLSPSYAAAGRAGPRYAVTAVGPTLGAREVHRLTSVLAHHGANVEAITRLASGRLRAVELHVALPADADPEPLRGALLTLSTGASFDVALQREGLFRRSKRLVVFDMDSTLIRIEVIDELAKAAGVSEQVAAITHRAMLGEMDYDASLRQRLALLEGLDVAVLENIAASLPFTEGAETLARVLKRLGYKLAVLSGGFTVAAEALQARLGFDYAHSNQLEVVDRKLTGRVVGPIVNGERKAELLEAIAAKEGVRLDQVIAVGDGANDLKMLERAGFGIAFRAKPRLREAADTAISASGLDAILFLLGMTEQEIREASAE